LQAAAGKKKPPGGGLNWEKLVAGKMYGSFQDRAPQKCRFLQGLPRTGEKGRLMG
jgi:hypothetical protein